MALADYDSTLAGLAPDAYAPDDLAAPFVAGGAGSSTSVLSVATILDHQAGQVAAFEGGKPGSAAGFLLWFAPDGSAWFEGSTGGANTFSLQSPAGAADAGPVVAVADGTTARLHWAGGSASAPQAGATAGGNESTWGSTGSGGTSPNGSPANVDGLNAVITRGATFRRALSPSDADALVASLGGSAGPPTLAATAEGSEAPSAGTAPAALTSGSSGVGADLPDAGTAPAAPSTTGVALGAESPATGAAPATLSTTATGSGHAAPGAGTAPASVTTSATAAGSEAPDAGSAAQPAAPQGATALRLTARPRTALRLAARPRTALRLAARYPD